MQFPKQLFVTGTDTNVGKTFVSALLCHALQTSYWKPIQSGLADETDSQFVARVAAMSPERILPELYKLNEPLSPHASAKIDGIDIDLEKFVLPVASTERLIVEGAGGLMVPINDRHYVLDIIKALGLPTLVVAHNRLGTINHTLLTIDKLRQNHVTVFGVVLNGPKNAINRASIEKYGNVTVVAEVEPAAEVNFATISKIADNLFGGVNGLSNLASVYADEDVRPAAPCETGTRSLS